MRFLNEGTFVGVGAVKDAIKDPEFKALKSDAKTAALKTLKLGGSVTTEDEENQGYGKDPETGKIIRQNREDAIQDFLDRVKQSVEDEGDEWPTINEDLGDKAASFIRKAGGAEYKTPFTDLLKSFDDWVEGKSTSKEEREKLIKQFANIHTAPQDEFDAFIKEMGKEGWDKDDIKRLIKKQKEYKAEKSAAENKKEEEKNKKETMNETVKEIVKKCLNKGMIKENISKVVKKYLAEVEGNLNQGDIVYLKSDYNRKAPFKVVGTRRMFGSDLPAYEVTPYPMGGFKVEYDETQLVK